VIAMEDELMQLAESGDARAAEEVTARLRRLSIADPSAAVHELRSLIARLGGRSVLRMRLLGELAHALCYVNDFAGAEAEFEAACTAARELGLDVEIPDLLIRRVQPLARMGRLSEAERAARAAHEGFLSSGRTHEAGRAAVNLAIVLRMQGRSEEALTWFETAAPLLAADEQATAALKSNLGEALLDLDRFAEAAEAFEAALDVFESGGHLHLAAIVEGNLADLAARAGRVDEAVRRFDAARAKYERVGAKADAARLLAEEAEALLTVGAWVKSERLYRAALPELRTAGLLRETARAALGAGLALARQGEIESSKELLDEAERAADASGAHALSVQACLARAEVARCTGNHEEAARLIEQAMSRLDDRPLQRLFALAARARIALDEGDVHRAMALLEEGERAAEGFEFAPLKARLLDLKGLALGRLGRHAEALAAHLGAVEQTDRSRGAIRADEVRTAYLESSLSLYAHACRAIRIANTPDAPRLLMGVIERMRARTLLESCAGSERNDRTEGEVYDRRRAEIVGELNSLYSRQGLGGRFAQQGGRSARDTGKRILELETALEQLLDREQASGAPVRPDVLKPITLEAAQAALPADAAIISYYLDGDDISALVVTRRSATMRHALSSRAAVAQLRRRAEFEIARAQGLPGHMRQGRPDESVLRTTSRLLLEPLDELLEGVERVFLIPCAGLHDLPLWAAAVVHGSDGDNGSRRARIGGIAPSAGVGLYLADLVRERASRTSGGGGSLVVAVADDVAPLMEREAEEIAEEVPGARVMLGAGATAEEFLAALPEHGLVHIACHCVFEPEFPMSSRIKLHDRWVTAREVAGRLARGAVAMLAGCESGRTSNRTGAEERFGLVRAFLGSGVGCVVASQWRLHDETARKIFVSLHRELAGENGSAAFRIAGVLVDEQARMRDCGVGWPDWGPLFVKGAIS